MFRFSKPKSFERGRVSKFSKLRRKGHPRVSMGQRPLLETQVETLDKKTFQVLFNPPSHFAWKKWRRIYFCQTLRWNSIPIFTASQHREKFLELNESRNSELSFTLFLSNFQNISSPWKWKFKNKTDYLPRMRSNDTYQIYVIALDKYYTYNLMSFVSEKTVHHT